MAEQLEFSALNVAPGRPARAPWVWLVLLVSALLCASSAYTLSHAWSQWRAAQEQALEQQIAKKRLATALRKQALERKSSKSLDRERDIRRIKEMAGLSWEGLFEVLEIAANRVRGGVSLVSMVPSSTQTTAGQVHIAALAANPGVMLFYIDELKKDPRVTRVELSQQQPEEKPATGVIRFQLEVTWNPSVELPPSKKPVPVANSKGPLNAQPVGKGGVAAPASLPPVPAGVKK